LSITQAPWGAANGSPVDLFTLTNDNGMKVNITDYGGVVQSIWVPDGRGRLVNVALGFSNLDDYVNDFENQPWPLSGGSGDTYFGAIIGRYANRIANASFTLDGKTYTLPADNGPNTLHGGPDSYNTQVWAATPESGPGYVALKLQYTDPDGKNGFPGTVYNTLTYSLTDNDALMIHYEATSTADTVINLTNHTYFNLAGEGSGNVLDQYLQINASTYQPTDQYQIPTGAFVPVAGTAFDFTTMHPIGEHIEDTNLPDGGGQPYPQLQIAHGYDHNWVLNGSGYRLAATAFDPKTGITLWEFTDQPGVQFYTGNFLVGDLIGTSGHAYRQTDGFTLETQHFPDTPHHIGQAGWPSVVLSPGQTFDSTTAYQFGVEGPGFLRHPSGPSNYQRPLQHW
jgi:aldose 1-epimerase